MRLCVRLISAHIFSLDYTTQHRFDDNSRARRGIPHSGIRILYLKAVFFLNLLKKKSLTVRLKFNHLQKTMSTTCNDPFCIHLVEEASPEGTRWCWDISALRQLAGERASTYIMYAVVVYAIVAMLYTFRAVLRYLLGSYLKEEPQDEEEEEEEKRAHRSHRSRSPGRRRF